ncbi:unnamed protein product [Dicrocoelium dendriticum]|nr:unnamed protein product [Dicrocoelium dendriticum]
MGKRPSAKLADDSKGQKASKRTRATTDSKKNTKTSDECNGTEKKNLQFSWCSTYPGSLPSLISPSLNKWNLKICSWNVNGLRAWLKAGGLGYVEEEMPDILGIQETKCSLIKIPADANLSSYKTYWSSAQKEGYAGTGLYSKLEPINVFYGINVSNHDVEGRVITAEYEKFYLITACTSRLCTELLVFQTFPTPVRV